ncbi:SRPBCC domain-containing protein [Psychromicrobium sp. YIM B11713]|uniref:SRPBCC domain-containing protein n=1 Tax=Psychromicrobium sp. YIM B11713 TaxID=3145233 RepID=UPI00374F6CF8
MDGLFSHPEPNDPPATSAPPPRQVNVLVRVPPEQAFEAFTDLIHLWWPLADYSAFGVDSHLGFERQSLLEEALDGRQHLWANVLDWQQPTTIALDFYLGGDPTMPTRLSVRFAAQHEGTTVSLLHEGWAVGSAGQEQYAKYADWPFIIGCYARFMGGPVS